MPPNHELFESQSIAELHLEFFEDMYAQRDEVISLLESDEKHIDHEKLYKQLNAINKALDLPEIAADPLIDKWEKELAEGLEPDLEEGLT